MPERVNNKTFVVANNSVANIGAGDPVVRGGNGKAVTSSNSCFRPPVVRKPVARPTFAKPPTLPKPAAADRKSVVVGGGGQQSNPSAQPVGHRAPPSACDPRLLTGRVRGPPAPGMERCPLCERDFAADRLPKHEAVCRSVKDREGKRKVFDGRKQRLQCLAEANGCDLLSLKKKVEQEEKLAAEKLRQQKKKKDELAAARSRGDALARSVSQTVRNDAVDMIRCPHCNRTFAEAAAERHIPGCGERTRAAADRARNKRR